MVLKPEYSLKSFRALVRKLNADPHLLNGDWQDLVRNEFSLSPQQEDSLNNLPEEQVVTLQDHIGQIARHIQQGGRFQTSVVQSPDGTREIRYALLADNTSTRAATPMTRIVCCDANCGHWRICRPLAEPSSPP